MTSRLRILSFLTVLFSIILSHAEENVDSVSTRLNEIVVSAKKTEKEVIPAQILSGEELEKLNSNNVADALRYFSGVQVKDYGGIGGIKTVNIRSMGSNNTGVVYDGVELGNAQNGQIDLGQFSLDNIESISLYNGQKSNILQPAKDFGNAGTVYMKTRRPLFANDERFHGRISFRTGSFDLINPSAILDFRIFKTLTVSLSTEWIKSSGRYKFRYKRVNPAGEVVYDTTAVRQNGDINAFRAEMNLYGGLANGNWQAKAYIYTSERGIPGAIVNNVWRRGERIWDLNSFIQGAYSGSFGKFSTLNNIKFGAYRTHYVNNDEWQLKIDNLYHQKELYLSSANQYELNSLWSISASYDFLWNTMSSDMYNFSRPDRYSNFLSIAAAFDCNRLKAQCSLLSTFIRDNRKGYEPSDKFAFSPALFLSGNPLHNTDFSLRFFFKQSFRMPTFNDLYYADIGNSSLKPEKVTQFNLGLSYSQEGHGLINIARINADLYYNYVNDKIIAYPKGQQFRWTMLNLGKVDIRGIDISGQITLNPIREFYITCRGQYTFQRAIDVTSDKDSYYRHQIPYIPRHSGAAILNVEWQTWALNYSWIYVGERYNQQENIIFNYTQPWYTSDLSLSKDFNWKKLGLRALIEINNLFSQDYDVILNYPMPKRNYRFTLSISI